MQLHHTTTPDAKASVSSGRRHALKTMAIGLTAAAAFTGYGTEPAPAASHEDAELIALGRRLSDLIERWKPLNERADRAWWVHEAACKHAGINRYDLQRSTALPEYQVFRSEQKKLEDVLDRIDDLCSAIRKCMPHSVEGLKSWAIATRFNCILEAGRMSDDPEDMEWQDYCCLRLIETIDAMDRVSA